jgi:hemolysin activation/secretion protein
VVERYAAKLRGMAPFDMRRVQRYILLASDIPGLKVRASVRPSTTGARGAVDLDLAVERDAEELTINAQNLQSKFTGRWGLLGRYDLNAHGKAGQRTSMVLYRTIRNEQWVAQGTHERRLGSEGAVVRASVAYGESRPGAGLKALGLKSTNVVVNVEGAYPLLRTRRENLWVSAGIEVVEQDTKIGPAKLINDDLRQLFLKLEGDQTVYYGYRPIVLRGQAGARQGFEGFGSSRAGDRTLSRADAKPDAWTLFAEGSVDVLVTPQWTVHAEVAGQYADKPLAAYAEYASGALTIGRGYDPGYVTGDKALAASLEVRGGPFQPWAGATFSPYAFFDVAHVSDNDRGGANQTLKSVGFGVQTPLRDNWVLDVGYARPLDKRAIARRKPTDRLTFNLTTRFF